MSHALPSHAPTRRGGPRSRQHYDLIHRRVRVAFGVLFISYVCLAARLFYLQVVRHAHYERIAQSIQQFTFSLPARRGSILDRNGVPLAVNVEIGDVIADPTEIGDPGATAAVLAGIVRGSSAAALQQSIVRAQSEKTAAGKPLRYLILLQGIPYADVQSFDAELKSEEIAHYSRKAPPVDLGGLDITLRQARVYPNGDLAAQVVGFVNRGQAGDTSTADISGKYGVESSMNSVLAGSDGSVTAETDAQRRIIPGTVTHRVATVNGANVRLTIDANLQRVAQDALEKSYTTYRCASGTVIVIDPTNGDILAMASLPTFNPGRLQGTSNLEWHNMAVTDLYEPGSTLKALTMSAVLDARGLQHQYDHVDCTGQMRVGRYIIHCAKDPPLYGVHGIETMRDILKNSCNIGAATYALALGAPTLYEYDGRFGLLQKPDTGLPGEEYCHLISPEAKPWSKIELANIAFGQGISMTPLQLASIYATLANNGVRVHPHVILGQGYTGPPQEVVKPEVAHTLLSMLQTVVTEGTGQSAQIGGYSIGGKTGSAQIAEHGHYGDQYIGSFCGVVPINHPRLVILCAMFRPKGVHWGAVVAAPVVHDIAKFGMKYLKVAPDDPQLVDWNDRFAPRPAVKTASSGRRVHRRAA